uniref:C-type lectin domain-containing protein n=1 Tax=Neogobius melanostomus TaxID=47308 RepID=A0A8C6SJP6_9GOBI
GCANRQEIPKQYVPVLTPLAWEDARSYCRQHHTDLAMIKDESENTAVASLLWGHAVWIGLYRDPWRWSDGTNSSFTNWDAWQPSAGWETCGLENSAQKWHDANCAALLPFICHKGKCDFHGGHEFSLSKQCANVN